MGGGGCENGDEAGTTGDKNHVLPISPGSRGNEGGRGVGRRQEQQASSAANVIRAMEGRVEWRVIREVGGNGRLIARAFDVAVH